MAVLKPHDKSDHSTETAKPAASSNGQAPRSEEAPKVAAAPNEKPQGAPTTNAPPRGRAKKTATIGQRRRDFMIAPRQVAGFAPMSADFIVQSLKNSPDIEVVGSIESPQVLGLQSDGSSAFGSIVLARMHVDKAKQLATQAGSRVLVEYDAPLTLGADLAAQEARVANPGVTVFSGEGFQATFEVLDDAGRPVPEAEVFLFGSVWPTQGSTDAGGRVALDIKGDRPETIQTLYVKPKSDYWSLWLPHPAIDPAGVNSVEVKPITTLYPDFPKKQLLGWGERAMGLDRLPPMMNGAGIKIAIIDSGAAQQTHRNLHSFGPGLSVVNPDQGAWTNDTIGHGSHCGGVIAGGPAGAAASGVRGFAPAAEIHVIQVFPGGQFNSLVQALDYCIAHEIDVVNMSLGGGQPSQIVEQRLIMAKQAGVACFVAAGNSGGPVQFPASSPHVLAVAAVGKLGEFPDDSFHATQIMPGSSDPDGYFSAKFSCFGPEVDVCGPGVAIVSSIPADGFSPWDGTSMATPHITGMGALILAHHPDFKSNFATRDAKRVERLFQIVKESATPMNFGDPGRTGAGLPNVARALGVDRLASAASTLGSLPVNDDQARVLAQLLGALMSAQAARPREVAANPAPIAPASALPDDGWRNPPAARGPAAITVGALRPMGSVAGFQSGFQPMAADPFAPTTPMPAAIDFNALRSAMMNAGLMQ